MGSESDVRHWGPSPAGRVRVEIRWCFGVKKAPIIGNQVAHQGLQGHVAPQTHAFYRPTGLLLSPTSTEQKWQLSQTPFNPAERERESLGTRR